MTLPLLRALRVSRPDAELTLVAKKQFLPLLETWQVADHLHALPSRGPGYFLHFRRLRAKFPDVWLLFTNSFRGDLEAWFTRCRHRFGIVRPGSSRPLLTHAYCPPSEFAGQSQHQLKLWENFLRHFGLNHPADLQPANGRPGTWDAMLPIGLIPGSENTPEKRWPVNHWRALVAALLEERFIVFGTANDREIAGAVAAGFGARVENLAGATDLVAFNERLRGCRLLVSNDTGGMHLANASGVPLIALFGPTNPVRTRPVFAAPVRILQPPECAATGGGTLEELRPESVIAALRELQQEWHMAGGSAS